jgi:hypothetical protein
MHYRARNGTKTWFLAFVWFVCVGLSSGVVAHATCDHFDDQTLELFEIYCWDNVCSPGNACEIDRCGSGWGYPGVTLCRGHAQFCVSNFYCGAFPACTGTEQCEVVNGTNWKEWLVYGWNGGRITGGKSV